MDNQDIFLSGFYPCESDKERGSFRWMQKHAQLDVKNFQGIVQLQIGYPLETTDTYLSISAKKRKRLRIFQGWNDYYINLDELDMEDDILELSFNGSCIGEENGRELCLMIGNISYYQAYVYNEKEYEICIAKDGAEILSRHTENGMIEGVLHLHQPFPKETIKYVDLYFKNLSKSQEFILVHFFQEKSKADLDVSIRAMRDGTISIPLPINDDIYFSTKSSMRITNFNIRNDYYDFMGLTKYMTEKSYRNLDECLSLGEGLTLDLQWFVTWACNYRCPYCWEESHHELYRKQLGKLNQILPDEWARAFNEICPGTIYFTGGEPTLYKYLPRLMHLLDARIKFKMTSNGGASFQPIDYAEFAEKRRFSHLAFSFHPSEISLEDFLRKMDECRDVGLNAHNPYTIELVLYPMDFEYVEKILKYGKQHGVCISLDEYHDEKSQYHYTEDERRFVQQVQEEARIQNLQLIDKIKKENNQEYCNKDNCVDTGVGNREKDIRSGDFPVEEVRGRTPIYCLAGSKKIHVDYKGDIFACMSAIHRSKLFGDKALPHWAPLGNLFDSKKYLLKKPVICWESFRCSACDYHHHGFAMRDCCFAKDAPRLLLPE